MENSKRVADDYEEIMHLVSRKVESYDTKKDMVMFLDALKTSISFSLKITKQVMKGRK
jgi:hypothetical protein